MKKVKLFFLLLSTATFLNAQDTAQQQSSKWSLLAGGSLDVNFFSRYEYKEGTFVKTKDHAFGYSLGLNTEYSISKNFSLVTGVNFSNKISYPGGWIFVASDPITGKKFAPAFLIKQETNLLEVPLQGKYYFLNQRKITPYIIGGLTFSRSVLTENTFVNRENTDEIIVRDENDKDLNNLYPELGFGFLYSISEKISLSLQPIIRFNLFSGTKVHSPVQKAGIGVFIKYNF